MASNGAPKPTRTGLSLYANLLDPTGNSAAPGTISRAPILNRPGGDNTQQDEASAQKQQISAASLRFQPTKRPQLSTQKPKPKPTVQKNIPQASTVTQTAATPSDVASGIAKPPPKNTLADWTADADDDVNGFYGGEKRQRGGRKKRKKNKEETQIPQNWDDIYDPSRPNSYEEYKHSEEKISEMREWKDRLYAHRMPSRQSSSMDSEDDRYRPPMNNNFAPPAMSFAPPTSLNDTPPPLPPPPVEIPDDPTGDDAYVRRMHLSQLASQTEKPSSPVQQPFQPPPPPPPSETTQGPSPPPPQPFAPISAPGPTISRAPVRYNLPAAPSELPKSEAELEHALQNEQEEEAEPEPEVDAQRSLRPGQKGFAERLMSKYGWTKGSGLGASGSGIVNPLRAQVVKQKKKPDAEGGGFAGPGGMGKIIGGKKRGGKNDDAEEGKFGAMSEVIMLRGMVDGMDLDAELQGGGDGGLMQEIGEECAEKYGRVERVFIDRATPAAPPVFIKFTSQLSALRAVNALEGRVFNGNTITAKFFDAEKFENGVYL